MYKYRWQILLALLGILFLGVGALWSRVGMSDTSSVEIIVDEPEAFEPEIVVEVSGEVKSPGVYEFTTGSRVNDALARAGGLTDTADTGWVEISMNRAAPLIDGQKIYVPKQGELESAKNLGGVSGSGSGVLGTISNTINVNTASATELEGAWGIGPVTAQNIIEQRPYSSVQELLDRGILKSNVYERNKDLLSVY